MRLYWWNICIILLTASFTVDYGNMPEIGDQAPDFYFLAEQDDTVRLSDFQGDYVFLDFWASWCGPCKKKHQALAEVYGQLNGQTISDSGRFVIISISLDTDSMMWRKGIEREHLVWPNHFCDFQRWNSAVVKQYGLSYIPYNFLVDPAGKVIAKGLSEDEIRSACLGLLDN